MSRNLAVIRSIVMQEGVQGINKCESPNSKHRPIHICSHIEKTLEGYILKRISFLQVDYFSQN